jgi:hypothetical protein
MFHNRVPMNRGTPSPKPLVCLFINSLIHVYLLESPKRSPLTYGKKHKVTVHGAPRRQKAYIRWVRPGSPSVSVMTLPSLPQCHAALGTIPSTLTWVDQSPVSQCVVATPIRVHLPPLLPPPMCSRVEYESTIP